MNDAIETIKEIVELIDNTPAGGICDEPQKDIDRLDDALNDIRNRLDEFLDQYKKELK